MVLFLLPFGLVFNFEGQRENFFEILFQTQINQVSKNYDDCINEVGRSRVDTPSSSDARGPRFEPRPLRFKINHFFTPEA